MPGASSCMSRDCLQTPAAPLSCACTATSGTVDMYAASLCHMRLAILTLRTSMCHKGSGDNRPQDAKSRNGEEVAKFPKATARLTELESSLSVSLGTG
eukprot:12578552-Alexandrium_andersonii.AAC.1